jgi:hypothetical protein
MIERVRAHLSYANVMATLAVFIALGGASYAATQLPKDSVGTRELKPESVGAGELKPLAVRHDKLREHSVGAENLRQNSVGPTSLQGNAVGFDQLAPDAVDSSKVKDFSLQYGDLDPVGVAPRMFAPLSRPGGSPRGSTTCSLTAAFVGASRSPASVSDSVPA